jgi:XisH protein
MAAKDRFHELVKQSLIQDNWIITDDPLLVRYGPTNLKVDLGAERVIGAQKKSEQIAVEIKSFLDPSAVNDFHAAIGQYLHYQLGFKYNQWERKLYLAVPSDIYHSEFHKPLFQDSVQTYHVKILVCTTDPAGIEQWIE